MQSTWEIIKPMLENPWIKSTLILAGSIIIAFLANMFMKRIIMKLAKKTESDFDDKIVGALRIPVFLSVILLGLDSALGISGVPAVYSVAVLRIMKSVVIIVWAVALGKISEAVFKWMEGLTRFQVVQDRTVPIFDILSMILIWGGASYLILLSWNIDVTGWLASAGVVGIAVGFAAKDTLANLFSGFFILADAPYKLGDFIVLGSGERGIVTDIGIRSTRILTRDEIEIIVPNAVIANTKIINETGGPHEKERVRCTVEIAYGSDIDAAREALLEAAIENVILCKTPKPRVRFRSFGASGLVFQVLAWIDEPVLRGRALDSLNTGVYKKLNARGIEIPYSKQDVYIKEMPKGS